MDLTTLLIYIAMYAYGFPLMIWTLFFDKRPTKLSRNSALVGLIALTLTLIYVIYVVATVGLQK